MASLTLDLVQVDEQGNITESCFKTFGCGSAIASSSVATEWYATMLGACNCLLHTCWIACGLLLQLFCFWSADVSKDFVHFWQLSVCSCVMSVIAYVCPVISDNSMISLTV